ncbi:MAG: NAD(P)H-hydrate dehydratase [Pirellulaceae bacterium]
MSNNFPHLPPRRPDSHKGDFGRALLIGGSRGMAGAIALSGMSCLRSGAGLVKLAVPECILDTVASFDPCLMTVPLVCDASGYLFFSALDQLQSHLKEATCVAVGPGLARSSELTKFVTQLYRTAGQPLVVDADGLNALIDSDDGLRHAHAPRILTPHPGEFSRLFGVGAKHRDQQIAAARDLAAKNNVVILLKGQQTFITDGARERTNTTGNPGMATGGTGDILTGVITALVCQGLPPFEAAVLGAHVHGLAGDLAASELGQVSLVASDLLRYLPKAFQSLAK